MPNTLLNYIHDAIQCKDTLLLQFELSLLEKEYNGIRTALDSQIYNRKRTLEQHIKKAKERIADLSNALTLLTSLPPQSYNLYDGFLQTVHSNLYNDLKEAQTELDNLQEEYRCINTSRSSLLEYYAQQVAMLRNKIELINDDNDKLEQMEHYFEEAIKHIS